MAIQSRREFLAGAGAFAIAPTLVLDCTQPQLILYHGKLSQWTIDGLRHRPWPLLTDGFLPSGPMKKCGHSRQGKQNKLTSRARPLSRDHRRTLASSRGRANAPAPDRLRPAFDQRTTICALIRMRGMQATSRFASILVVLGRDPLREHPSSLINIPVERTMVGGRWVFEA